MRYIAIQGGEMISRQVQLLDFCDAFLIIGGNDYQARLSAVL